MSNKKLYTIKPLQWEINKFGVAILCTPFFNYSIYSVERGELVLFVSNETHRFTELEEAYKFAEEDFTNRLLQCLEVVK